MQALRIVRSAALGVFLVAGIVAVNKPVLAAPCQSWSGSWDFISLSYCGAYPYENDALSDMESKADGYAQAYYFQGGVHSEPYWWARVTPFDEDGYYDSYWAVCAPELCD